MKILFAIAVLVVLSESHICLLNPYQRGAEVSDSSFNTEGSEACYLIKGPCGGVNASDSTVREYIAGETMTVTFQKNLNHFYESSPGNFTVRLFASERAEEAEYFGSTADTSSSSLSIYEVTGVIGSGIGGWHVLQVVYYPNKPSEPSAFYQCADIMVVSGNNRKDDIKSLQDNPAGN